MHKTNFFFFVFFITIALTSFAEPGHGHGNGPGAGPGNGRGGGMGPGNGHGHGPSRGHGKWNKHKVSGDGCRDKISVIVNGDTLSVLFDNFTVNMPMGDPGGDGLVTRKFCNFQTELTPPEGMVLAGFRQVFNGGMIKSKGAKGMLRMGYRLGGPPQMKQMVWNAGESIGPDHPASIFSQAFEDTITQKNRCKDVQLYDLRLELSAQRRDRTDYFVGGLDSVDTQMLPSVSVEPLWKACQ